MIWITNLANATPVSQLKFYRSKNYTGTTNSHVLFKK